MLKKFCALLLASGIILTFSCSKTTETTSDGETTAETAETATADPYDPMLPDQNFEGYELRMLNISPDSTFWWSTTQIDASDQTGDTINDAIYQRNRTIESRYNFTIKLTEMPDEKLLPAIKNSVSAGTDDYDVITPPIDKAGSMAVGGLLADMKDLKYIDFSRPWWNTSTLHNFSIGGKFHFATSDFTLSNNDATTILMYNKVIAADIGTPSDTEMYKTVEEGKWTQDLFFSIASKAPADLNGDGKRSMGDRFGIAACGWAQAAFMGACNLTFTSKDENDMPVFTAGGEEYINMFEKVAGSMRDKALVVYEYTDFNATLGDLFMNDYALFALADMSCVRLYKAMKSDFAILPFPKADEAQDKYYSFMVTSTCIAVPTSNSHTELTGLALEALSAESGRVVIPAYYEVAVAKKYFRDDQSFRILEMILENPVCDTLYWIYQWGGFNGAFDSFAQTGKTEFASLVEKYKDAVNKDIQKTVNAYISAK